MPPVTGFMGFSVPEVQGIPHALTPEGIAELLVILQENIFFPYNEDDLLCFQEVDQLLVIQVGNELAGHVVIDILIPMAFEKVFKVLHRGGQVIASAEPHHLVKMTGVFKCQVGGVISAQAAAGSHHGKSGVLLLYQRYHFFQQVLFVLEMAEDPVGGRDTFVIKTFPINAVKAIYLDLTAFDLTPQGVDDMPVLVVIKMGCPCGEEQHGLTGLTEDQQFHIPL